MPIMMEWEVTFIPGNSLYLQTTVRCVKAGTAFGRDFTHRTSVAGP